jgi:hypothetical protein
MSCGVTNRREDSHIVRLSDQAVTQPKGWLAAVSSRGEVEDNENLHSCCLSLMKLFKHRRQRHRYAPFEHPEAMMNGSSRLQFTDVQRMPIVSAQQTKHHVRAADSCFRCGHNFATCRAKLWPGPSSFLCSCRNGKSYSLPEIPMTGQPALGLFGGITLLADVLAMRVTNG